MFDTARLTFSITNEEDIPDLLEALNDPVIANCVSFLSLPFTQEDAESWARKSVSGFEDKQEWLFTAREKEGRKYVGSINLHLNGEKKAEIGYWVAKDFRGLGYGKEMLEAALRYGFQNLLLNIIFATTALDNFSSAKILLAHNFKQVKTTLVDTTNGPRESLYFEISSSDF